MSEALAIDCEYIDGAEQLAAPRGFEDMDPKLLQVPAIREAYVQAATDEAVLREATRYADTSCDTLRDTVVAYYHSQPPKIRTVGGEQPLEPQGE